MKQVSLFDGSFSHARSATFGGDCLEERPSNAKWIRPTSFDNAGKIAFLTDMFIDKVEQFPKDTKKIAWLIEPPSMTQTHFGNANKYEDYFDHILTFDMDFLFNDPKRLYYALGGSWIAEKDWGVFEKTKMVSMIASFKRRAPGHKIRHEIAERSTRVFDIDVMGTGYKPIESKIEGLRPYRYSIVVESIKILGYFSEKLIDCISQGTIPIYWGDPGIGDCFNIDGIIPFDNMTDLTNILINVVGGWDYTNRLVAIHDNLQRAHQYRCAEDWIFNKYPSLFEA